MTLVFPSDVTPLVLLTTIASTVSWAFTTPKKTKAEQKALLMYTGLASFVTVVCILLGVTASIIRPDADAHPGHYVFLFDSNVAVLANTTVNYLYFAIPVCILICCLMLMEICSSWVNENSQYDTKTDPQPLPKSIKQQLSQIKLDY